MSVDPRFTRWRSLFLAEKRNIALETILSAGLSVQYLQPGTPSLRGSEGMSEALVSTGGSQPGLTFIDGASEGLANADSSKASAAPASGSGAAMNP